MIFFKRRSALFNKKKILNTVIKTVTCCQICEDNIIDIIKISGILSNYGFNVKDILRREIIYRNLTREFVDELIRLEGVIKK